MTLEWSVVVRGVMIHAEPTLAECPNDDAVTRTPTRRSKPTAPTKSGGSRAARMIAFVRGDNTAPKSSANADSLNWVPLAAGGEPCS